MRSLAFVFILIVTSSAFAARVVSKPTTIKVTATGCPAYPAFPKENCTGWKHTGVSLTAYTGPTTITTAGTVIDGKTINSSITIQANNVTIRRSQINGQVFLGGSKLKNVLVEDVAIDAGNVGGNAAGQCIGGNSGANGGETAADFIIRRADIQGCAQGVYGRGFTLEDSYVHGLYGTGADHTEAILGHTGNIVIRHNNLIASYRLNNISGGGMSAVIALYTHSDFWGDIDGVVVEKNRMETATTGAGQAGYCMYGGGSPDNSGNSKNTIYKDNVFALGAKKLCGAFGAIVYLPSGGNNCWSANKYEDGTVISGSGLPNCN